MTINYTTLLGLAEPVTGTESGTWGDDVNKGITDYLDIAVAGTQTISGTQTAVTLSITNGSSAGNNISQVGSGSTGSSQYQIINCTGSPASTLTITAPASSKTYVVINATSTSQSVKIVGTGPTTGVTIVSGDKALVAWNGTDFVRIGASAGGSNTQVQYNSGGNLAGSANLTFDGTTLTANALTLTNKLTVANGGTGLNTTTAYGVITAGTTSTGAFQQVSGTGQSGYVLTSNGAGALPSWQAVSVSGAYTRTSFTATSGQTTFTVSYTVGYVQVYLNGAFLNGTDYTATNGTSIVLASGAATGDIVEVIAMTINAVGNAANITGGSAGAIVYNSAASTTTFLSLGTSNYFLTAGASAPQWSQSGTGVLTALANNTNATGGVVTVDGTATLTNKTLTNPTVTNYTESVVAIGTVTTSNTISLTNGTVQTATLTASTACTFTMPTATAGKSFILLLKQAASTGNGTATFTGVKWGTAGAPTITATAGKMDILTFVSDGTNWYGSVSAGYTP